VHHLRDQHALPIPIAVAEFSPPSVYTQDYEKLRRRPYGARTVHVSSEARAEVLAAAALRKSVQIVSTSRRVRTRASNVVIIIQGRNSSWSPVVVMTPRSS
jgi:hypothetical protein